MSCSSPMVWPCSTSTSPRMYVSNWSWTRFRASSRRVAVAGVAPRGRVGGRLEFEKAVGSESPGRTDRVADVLESGRLRDGHGQVVEAVGQLADWRRIVHHHGRHLIGGGLSEVAGLGL